jgi:NADH-quinone oxidoreductase subunit J
VEATFYVAAAAAVLATGMVITRRHAVHALLWFIVSLFAVAVIFYTLGAPFVAALEVIVYAGAIMVLFLFVVMLLNLGPAAAAAEGRLLSPGAWVGPAVVALVLAFQLGWLIWGGGAAQPTGRVPIEPADVGSALFGPYLLGAEICGLLLLTGLVAAAHLGRRRLPPLDAGREESP